MSCTYCGVDDGHSKHCSCGRYALAGKSDCGRIECSAKVPDTQPSLEPFKDVMKWDRQFGWSVK